MLAVLLALGAAASFGGSDYAAGLAVRQADVVRVTATAEVITAVLMVALVLARALSGGRLTAARIAGLGLAAVSVVMIAAAGGS